MNIFGVEVNLPSLVSKQPPRSTYPVSVGSGGWWNLIREPFAGAWQRNIKVNVDSVLTYHAVFTCISLISSDIAKMRVRLVQQDPVTGIREEMDNPAFSPVLRKPNHYQTRIQFFANWLESKLIHGNTYVLKQRDGRNVVTEMYVLDPTRVTVLLAPDGSVFYELSTDELVGIKYPSITIPANEIIHDRYATINHPLVGVSPIHAHGVAAMQGLQIQGTSTQFFSGGANPSGLLIAPTAVDKEKAEHLRELWNKAYGSGGSRVGTVAVLGDGLQYTPLTMSAVDTQLLEQLKWTAEVVCATFKVPTHMVGIGQPPTYNNVESLNQQYYSQCLQRQIEDIEALLNDGMGLGAIFGNNYNAEFNLEDLLRMDTATKMKVNAEGVRSGIFSPDEARYSFNLKPVPGGKTPYLQQQNFSLEALQKRDQNNPFPQKPAAPPPSSSATPAVAPAKPEIATAPTKSVTSLSGKDLERACGELLTLELLDFPLISERRSVNGE